MRFFKYSISIVLLIVFAGAGFLVYSAFQIDEDIALVMAVRKDTRPLVSNILYWRLLQIDECPEITFSPSSPLSFVLAGIGDKENNIDRSRELFEHFLNVGCNIEMRDNYGLTVLHSTALSKDPIGSLWALENGANPNTKVLGSSKIRGMDALEVLEFVCEKNLDNCRKTRDVLLNEI